MKTLRSPFVNPIRPLSCKGKGFGPHKQLEIPIDELIESEALVIGITRRSISDSADLWIRDNRRYQLRGFFPFHNEPLFSDDKSEEAPHVPEDRCVLETGAPGSIERIRDLTAFYSLTAVLGDDSSPFADAE